MSHFEFLSIELLLCTDHYCYFSFFQDVTIDEPYLSRKKLKEQKSTTTKESTKKVHVKNVVLDGWTQIEQKQLEVAIRSIPKGVPERWDRIADCVPTKTKVSYSGFMFFKCSKDFSCLS